MPVWAVLAGGLAIRLALAPFGSYRGDIHQFRGWASQLDKAPLSSFYGSRHLILDHLPGDLWILLGVEKLHHLLPGVSFIFLIKLVPAVADTGIAAVLYLAGRKLRGHQAGLVAASLFAFNPAALFLSSIWGQWDSVSAFFALAALWLLLERKVGGAVVSLTAALLIKPPFAALIPLLVLAVYALWMKTQGAGRRSLIKQVLAGGAGSIGLAALVLLPFGVGVPPYLGRWSLVDRISYAWNYRKNTSTSAFNFWGLPFGNGRWRDNHHFLLNLTFETWGKLLTGVAIVVILVIYWRSLPNAEMMTTAVDGATGQREAEGGSWRKGTGSEVMLVWAAFATTFSTFMLSTRQHERYLLPAVVFAALVAISFPGAKLLYSLLTLTFLVNLYAIYAIENPAPHPPWPQLAPELRYVVSFVNVVLLGYGFVVALHAPLLVSRKSDEGAR